MTMKTLVSDKERTIQTTTMTLQPTTLNIQTPTPTVQTTTPAITHEWYRIHHLQIKQYPHSGIKKNQPLSSSRHNRTKLKTAGSPYNKEIYKIRILYVS